MHVTIDGPSYHLDFDAATDRDGTYTAVFGSTVPPGDYTLNVSGSSGRATMAVHIG